MLYHAKEQTLTLSELEMDYITFGCGTKTLIMIQGLSTRSINGAALSLAWMYRIFAKDYKVYLFDRRKNIHRNITVRELASDIALAMDALGISNADVFGVSQGGMIAQYLAIDRPDLVHKLVLAVTLSRNNSTVIEVVQRWITMSEQGNWKALVSDMAEKVYSSAYIKRYKSFLPLLTLLQKPQDVPRFVTLAKACLTCETYDKLDQIRCPVLVLGGAQDKIVTGEASSEMAQKLGAELHIYNELGHAAYEEAKDFNQRVYHFFN